MHRTFVLGFKGFISIVLKQIYGFETIFYRRNLSQAQNYKRKTKDTTNNSTLTYNLSLHRKFPSDGLNQIFSIIPLNFISFKILSADNFKTPFLFSCQFISIKLFLGNILSYRDCLMKRKELRNTHFRFSSIRSLLLMCLLPV